MTFVVFLVAVIVYGLTVIPYSGGFAIDPYRCSVFRIKASWRKRFVRGASLHVMMIVLLAALTPLFYAFIFSLSYIIYLF